MTAVVKDSSGNVMAGVTVSWSTDVGSFDLVTSVTGSNGKAANTLRVASSVNDVVCAVTARAGGASGQATMTFTPDIWPQNHSRQLGNLTNAGIGSGRSVPLVLTLLKPVTPPAPAEDADYNWPPIPGVRLKAKVGRLDPNTFAYVEDPAYGAFNASNVTTDSNGQVLLLYTPPATCPVAGQTWALADVWVEDRRQIKQTLPVALRPPSSTDSVRCAWTGYQVYTNAHINCKYSISDDSVSGPFDTGLNLWDAVRDAQSRRHWQLLPQQPDMNGLIGFEAFSNYPLSLDDRGRDGYASTQQRQNQYDKVTFNMETIKPRPQFTPFPPPGTPGLELNNVQRTFYPTLDSSTIESTACHEIAHCMSLMHTSDSNAQLSIMCEGINAPPYPTEGGVLRWLVNGVKVPSPTDKLSVLTTVYPNPL